MSTDNTQTTKTPPLPQPILTLPNSISIRPWHVSDAAAMADCANNIKIWRNMTDRFPHPYTVADADWWINRCNDTSNWLSTAYRPAGRTRNKSDQPGSASVDTEHDSALSPLDFAICHENQPIGAVGLEPDGKAPRAVSLGYWLAEPYWGRGIATSVATAFSQWAFDRFPWLVRIDSDAYSWNEGSQRVLKKSGFVYEGRQKLKVCKEDKFGDLVLFGKVRDGWTPELMETKEP